jgi:hypothetical protein
MVANIARGAAVFLVLLASGCGGGGETGTTSGGGGGGGGGGGSGGGSGGGPVEVTYPFGLFQLESSVVDGFPQTFAQGAFQNKATPGCDVTTVGVCVLNDCRKAMKASLASGGKLTVTGGDSPITLMESASDIYSFSSTSTTWSSGTKLTLKASGGAVPAFSIQGQAPPIFTLTTPSFDLPVNIDRSQDFELVWTGANEIVQVLLVLNPDKSVSLNCSFDGAPGKGTIPAEILGKISTTSADDWSMVVHQANKTVMPASDWTVELVITQIGKTKMGTSTGGTVTLQ